MNIWDDDLEPFVDERSFGSGRKRLLSFDGQLGASVWEIAPGKTQIPYHFQHVQEELLLVLRGRPVLRTPDGERALAEGDVAHFPTGPTGAHALRNDSDEPVRVLWISTLATAEIAELSG